MKNTKKVYGNKKTTPDNRSDTLIPRIPVIYLTLLVLFWTYIVASKYYNIYPVVPKALKFIFSLKSFSQCNGPGFVNALAVHLSAVFMAAVLVFSFYGLGNTLLEIFKLEAEVKKVGRLVFSFSLGISSVIIITLLLGFLGLLYKWLVVSYMVVFSLLGIWKTYNHMKMPKVRMAGEKDDGSQPLLKISGLLHFKWVKPPVLVAYK